MGNIEDYDPHPLPTDTAADVIKEVGVSLEARLKSIEGIVIQIRNTLVFLAAAIVVAMLKSCE